MTGASSSATAIIVPERSPTVLLIDDERVDFLTVTGQINFTGGDCPDASCAIFIHTLELLLPEFTIAGQRVRNARIINDGTAFGEKGPDNFFTLDRISTLATALAIVSDADDPDDPGTFRSAEFFPQDPVTGEIDVFTGGISLSGTFFQEGSEGDSRRLDFNLVAFTDNLLPTADAGPNQVLNCDPTTGVAIATLDASGSSDFDGNLLASEWFRGAGAVVNLEPLGPGPITTASFGVGEHVATVAVVDTANEQDTDSLAITVVNVTPPQLDVTIDNSCLWPPNHKYVSFTLGTDVVVSTDSGKCKSPTEPPPSITLVAVVSNEPDDGLGDGSTSDDVIFGPLGACLRAERAGRGSGREYTLTLEAADSSGTTQVDVIVQVPHDRRPANCKPDKFPSARIIEDPNDERCDFSIPAGIELPGIEKTTTGCEAVPGGTWALLVGVLLMLRARSRHPRGRPQARQSSCFRV